MAETLSQSDIDALLSTFAEENAPAEPLISTAPPSPSGGGRRKSAPIEGGGESYDFSHPELLSRDQVRSLRTLHEGYAQALAKRLSTEFLTNVSAAVVSVDHLTYGEFLMLLPTPTVLSVVEVESLEGNIAIDLNPNIAFAFIDRLLGGVGQPLSKIRTLTAIEQGLMERVLVKCCQEMGGIWAPIQEITFRLQSIEGNPELARVVGPNEMVILVSLELRMNDVSGMMNLCLPYVVMETPIHKLGHGASFRPSAGGHRVDHRTLLEKSLKRAPVAIDVELGSVDLTMGEVLSLEVGDVLRIHSPAEGGAQAMVEGVPRLLGSPGRSHGNLAFRVDGVHGTVDDEGREQK